jgi:hypothetical protein
MANVVKLSKMAPDEAFGESGLSLAIYLYILFQTFKSAKWSAEREFRYVYQFFEGNIPENQVFKSRFAGGVEKTYIEADFSSVALKQVIVGPENDKLEAETWLRRVLNDCSYRDTAIIHASLNTDVRWPSGG